MNFHTRSHASGPGTSRGLLTALLLALSASALPASVSAQYFGRNKVQYETFDFKILKTPHYDIHFYPEEGEAVEDVEGLVDERARDEERRCGWVFVADGDRGVAFEERGQEE